MLAQSPRGVTPWLVGMDITPLASGHAMRGIGRYVENILDALLTAQPGWCLEHLGLLATDRQKVSPEVHAVWRSRRASFRAQDVGWIVAAVSDRAAVRRAADVRLWHETDPAHPLGPDSSGRAIVTAYDLIPLLEPAAMAMIRPHRRVAYRLYIRRLCRARQVLAISYTTASDLRSVLGIPSRRIHVVYPAVRRVGPKLGDDVVSDKRVPAIIFVGVLPGPHKRPDLAVEAFAEYRRMGGKRRLVFIGYHSPIDRARLRSLVEARRLAANVEFWDLVDDGLLASTYAKGVLLALSTREGFGLPAVECLLAGGQVVATPSPIYREVLADAAVYSLDDSPGEIAMALLAAEATHPPERAVQEIARRYSPASVASDLIRVYEHFPA